MVNTVKPGTKVMVFTKTWGCPLEHVMNRTGDDYPRKAPFVAWAKECHKADIDPRKEVYTITYTPSSNGGDYYRRSDFEVDHGFLKDEDFLI